MFEKNLHSSLDLDNDCIGRKMMLAVAVKFSKTKMMLVRLTKKTNFNKNVR